MEENILIGITFFVIAMFVMAIVVIIKDTKEEGYKQGQIDALSGNPKYELGKNEHGETVWKKIKSK